MRIRDVGLVALVALTGCEEGTLGAVDMYFVQLDVPPDQVQPVVDEIAGGLGLEPVHVFDAVTTGFSVPLPELIVPDLRKLPEVKSIRKDEKVERTPPNEPLPDEDEVLDDPTPVLGPTEIPESIARIGGPYLGSADWSDLHVAVIDTGVDGAHPDLNVVAHYDAVAEGGGSSFPNQDPHGHGTHVAGTIAALGDGAGVVGVAPGVPIHGVRVLDEFGAGYTSDIVAGLEYVAEHPEIRVVNMSLGGLSSGPGDPMEEAIAALEASGVVVVVAAGNDGADTAGYAPAGFDLGVTVSAYDAAGDDNGFAWFSNYGDAVDIAAPGVAILSTWPGGGYAQLDGTSMATPAVAGAVAAYLAQNPNAGVTKVRNTLISTAEEGLPGQGGDHPEGLLDVTALWE